MNRIYICTHIGVRTEKLIFFLSTENWEVNLYTESKQVNIHSNCVAADPFPLTSSLMYSYFSFKVEDLEHIKDFCSDPMYSSFLNKNILSFMSSILYL